MSPHILSHLAPYTHIVVVGGGTGGHIQPIVSLYRHLHIRADEHIPNEYIIKDILWIGWKNSAEAHTADTENIPYRHIPTLKLSTTYSWRVLLYPLYLLWGIYCAVRILRGIRNSLHTVPVVDRENSEEAPMIRGVGGLGNTVSHICIFSKWWPGSVAVGIAGYILGIPLYIHESDTIPGRSSRILSRFAHTIFLGFASAGTYFRSEKCIYTGQVLDPVFTGISRDISQNISTNLSIQKSIDPVYPHLLVLCGSQGSRAIFTELLKNLQYILDTYHVTIVLGRLNTDMRAMYETVCRENKDIHSENLTMLDYVSQVDLADILHTVDICITRGSATTLAELDTYDILKVIIPLPYSGWNHQYYNALEYVQQDDKKNILLEQKDIHRLIETLGSVYKTVY